MVETYKDKGVKVLIVDVAENFTVAKSWVEGHKFTFPVLWDSSGAATAQYAPQGLMPDLPRFQVPIGSNLLIDREGVVKFFTLLDTRNFDARLVGLRGLLDSLLASESQDDEQPEENKQTGSINVKVGDLSQVQTLKVGESANIGVPLTVKDGLHVQANPAGLKTLIPLQLHMQERKEIQIDDPVYPPGEKLRLKGSDFDLFVYSGSFQVQLPIVALGSTEGKEVRLNGWLQYQSCDHRTCYAPDSVAVSIPVRVE